MPLTIKDVLSCTWLLHMGSQESSRYGHRSWDELVAQILAFRAMRPGKTLTQYSAFFSQAVINSGVRVDLEARDFEGKLGGRWGRCGRWGGAEWCSTCRALTFCIPQASPHSTQPSWPSMLLCTHLTSVPGC